MRAAKSPAPWSLAASVIRAQWRQILSSAGSSAPRKARADTLATIISASRISWLTWASNMSRGSSSVMRTVLRRVQRRQQHIFQFAVVVARRQGHLQRRCAAKPANHEFHHRFRRAACLLEIGRVGQIQRPAAALRVAKQLSVRADAHQGGITRLGQEHLTQESRTSVFVRTVQNGRARQALQQLDRAGHSIAQIFCGVTGKRNQALFLIGDLGLARLIKVQPQYSGGRATCQKYQKRDIHTRTRCLSYSTGTFRYVGQRTDRGYAPGHPLQNA